MGLLKLLLLLCASGCLCQRDCTGVDCPILNNCIEEVLENGACCATCLQTGCTCEGYQYYDCVNAGFRTGRVPEGESYFVDFGSTECSCPQGGGRISCHFIPCPELPANCIEVAEPADGCTQCERIGCVYEGQKYEAGHSFHMHPCQVCHCPNDGGNLMCYPIPDCDPRKVHKPMLETTTEENAPWKRQNNPVRNVVNHQGSRSSFSKPFPLSHADLPPFNQTPGHMDEEMEDYDYHTTDSSETALPDLTSPLESPVILGSDLEKNPPYQIKTRKQELKERFGVYGGTTDRPQLPLREEQTDGATGSHHKEDQIKDMLSISEDITEGEDKKKISIFQEAGELRLPLYIDATENPSFYKDNTNTDTPDESTTTSEELYIPKETTEGDVYNLYEDTTYSETVTESPETVPQTTQETDTTTWQFTTDSFSLGQPLTPEPTEHYSTDSVEESIESEHNDQIVTISNATNDEVSNGKDEYTGHVNGSSGATDEAENYEPDQKMQPEVYTIAPVILNPTTQSHLTVKAQDEPDKESQSLYEFTEKEDMDDVKEEREEPGNTLSSLPKASEVESCCTDGQKWASEKQHCNHLPPGTDPDSVCGAIREQCCVGALRESRCLAGMIAAKAGEACEENNNPHCGDSTQKECCSCCALGLHLRREGRGCDVHHYLSYPCGHIFLTCCEGEEDGHIKHVLKRKERPRPTTLPERVADRQFPKQPFSMEDSDHASNSVEKMEDVDECERYEGRLCHHTCVNTLGSYMCECHPGYVLMQDGHTCTLENPEEDNRVIEDDRPFTPATQLQETTQISPTPDPCAGNGPCSQHCSVVRGEAHCSCSPGFSLQADGQTCQDLNECVTNTHTCLANERCVNTVGAFVCERQISCQSGYQLRNGVCEDVDECVMRSHNCGSGFQCQNTLGSFRCSPKQQRCVAGFSQDPHGNCIDIDECSVVREPCSSGFNCINTVGSYTCQRKVIACSRGYHASSDGVRCVDVDECATGTHRCTEGQICHNLPGSYRCECQAGYQYDASRRLCVDVNECWRYPGRLCSQTCENTVGSYQCSCTTGFSLTFDGKNCEDINECDNNPCSQECANIYGSYQCYCRVGYYLKEDGHTCEDIDECSQSIGNMCTFQCVNVQGSYQCACPPHGYSMSPNGRTCQDIDECATGTHNCTAVQTCYNLQGSFRCLSFTCPENYRKVSDTRCERTSCVGSRECQSMPIRITYYQLSYQTNVLVPAQIFRIGPSPAYSGDNIIVSITRGNDEGYFSTRRLNSYTGAVYLQREVHRPRDFLIDVEMKLLRQGTVTTFLARIYVFITAHAV